MPIQCNNRTELPALRIQSFVCLFRHFYFTKNDQIYRKVENVTIANALQLEAARRRAVHIRFNFVARANLNSLSLSVAVLERFYCLYVRLRCDLELWPRDLDLWPLTLNICSRPCSSQSNSVRNLSEIEQSAAELLQLEYLTLWHWTRITRSAMLWDSLHKV